MRGYTKDQLEILNFLRSAGYGWRKYAENVLSQGWISRKQSDTICVMYTELNTQRSKATRPKYKNSNRSRYGEMYDYGVGDNFEYADYGGQGEYF